MLGAGETSGGRLRRARPPTSIRRRGCPTAEAALAGARDIVAERCRTTPTRGHGCASWRSTAACSGRAGQRQGNDPEKAEVQEVLRLPGAGRKLPPASRSWRCTGARRRACCAWRWRPADRGRSSLASCAAVRAAGRALWAPPRAAIADAYKPADRALDRNGRARRDDGARPRSSHPACSPRTCATCCCRRRSGASGAGLDPGFRTGCKLAVRGRDRQAAATRRDLPDTSERQAAAGRGGPERPGRQATASRPIAIGNGTAGRETEQFVPSMMKRRSHLPEAAYMIVNESGRLGLLGLQDRPRGVPRPGRDRARRGLDRPAAAGPAGRAGQDRPQGDRRRPVPARRQPEAAGRDAGRRGGVGGEPRRRRRQHGLAVAAGVRGGHQGDRRPRTSSSTAKEHGTFTATGDAEEGAAPRRPRRTSRQRASCGCARAAKPLDGTAVHPESYARGREAVRNAGAEPGAS